MRADDDVARATNGPTRTHVRSPGGPATADAGTAIGMAGIALAMAGMLVVVAIDAGAYLLAASRAQATADSAALAAAIAIEEGRSPDKAAEDVAAAAEAEVVTCTCATLPVEVEIGVGVDALVITQWGPRRVVASAQATILAGQ